MINFQLLTDADEPTTSQPPQSTIETHSTSPSTSDTEEELIIAPTLSPSAFVPINYEDNTSDEGNGKVKFSRVAEVRKGY